MAVRFIQFVRMHTHNAGLCLGRTPHAQTGKRQVNLEVAKMLIDQLVAIQFKTKGNLTPDEETVLTNALAGLQEDYLKAVEDARGNA